MPVLGAVLIQVIQFTIAAFIVVAAFDYIFQRRQFMNEQKMTKDEVKQEYKESEGDPEIKGKRRQLALELAQNDSDAAVRKSSVIVTNPTHIAVALDYREGETPLPIVTAMGQNIKARRIVQIAQEEGIPILENVPVARGLYETAEINQYIPSDMIEAVAEVMRYVRDLTNAP